MASESAASWETHFDDLIDRGMAQPLFVVSDSGKGLKAALTKSIPYATCGRCIAHNMRNLVGKLPREDKSAVTLNAK